MPNFWILSFSLLLASWVLAPAFPRSELARRAAPWLRLSGLAVFGWAGWALPGAIVMVLLWLLLPWLELSTRGRGIRLPEKIVLRNRHLPSGELFPDLRDSSREIEQAGFSKVADLGWENQEQKQFLRLFRDESGARLVALHCVEQGALSFSFVGLTQVDQDGTTWRSWNSPLPSGLSQPPSQRLQRVPAVESFADLLDAHARFVPATTTWRQFSNEEIAPLFENESCRQLEHNRARGLLSPAPDFSLRYTWRGIFYLYGQVLRQMLAL